MVGVPLSSPLAARWTPGGKVPLLTAAEKSPLFQKLRGDLLVSLYNNPEVWAKFGYEGASADKGGYVNRGFNDIDWV